MKREEMSVGPYKIAVEHYDAYVDKVNVTKRFLFLRSYNIFNNIADDNHIFMIDEDAYEYMCDELQDTMHLVSEGAAYCNSICFTTINSNYIFSARPKDMNDLFLPETLIEKTEFGDYANVNYIYRIKENQEQEQEEQEPEKASLLCDELRIYKPDNLKSSNFIICVYNILNNIRFTYICKPMISIKKTKCADNEFEIANEIFQEYISVYIPSMTALFNDEIYYKEDLNDVQSVEKKFDEDGNVIEENVPNDVIYKNDQQYVRMKLFLRPYEIYETEIDNYDYSIYYKKFELRTEPQGNRSAPLVLTLSPYSYIDDTTNLYVYDPTGSIILGDGVVTFIYDNSLSLSCKIGFADGKLSAICKFVYPKRYDNMDLTEGLTPLQKAYADIYNILPKDYTFKANEGYEKKKAAIEAINSLTSDDMMIIDNYLSLNPDIKRPKGYEAKLEFYKQMLIDSLDEEYKEDFEITPDFLGYGITLYSDSDFRHKIYTQLNNLKKPEENELPPIDDFLFPLNDIFSSWDKAPHELFLRCEFIDRYQGVTLLSNICVLTKEHVRYMISHPSEGIYRLTGLAKQNAENIFLYNSTDMIFNDLNNSYSYVAFINTVHCNVIDNTSDDKTEITTSRNTPRIIYRPVFYKVQDLQSIRLRDGQTQNIGLNLIQYMSKVDTFKLIINGREFTETGRNDALVIFSIAAGLLDETSGKYDITNQDGEYISSGDYIIV